MGKLKDKREYVGDIAINFQGYEMIIIDARTTHDIDVQFNDDFNTIYQHKKLTDFYRGKIKNPNYLLGLKSIATNGMSMRIIDGDSHDLTIEFEDGTVVSGNLRLENFKRGIIRNPNANTFFGVGKMGIGCNTVSNPIEFNMWSGMLERCYSKLRKESDVTYKDCTSSEYFRNFQNFVYWYNKNKWNCDNKLVLDKDILIKGNKLYSENTCVLVDRRLNNLFTGDSKACRGKYLIGVIYRRGKFEASYRGKWIGAYLTEWEAFNAYKSSKEQYIKQIADEYKSKYQNFPQKLYDAMYSYEVEIND